MDSRSPKRLKVSHDQANATVSDRNLSVTKAPDPAAIRRSRAAFLSTVSRSISPPGVLRSSTNTPRESTPQAETLSECRTGETVLKRRQGLLDDGEVTGNKNPQREAVEPDVSKTCYKSSASSAKLIPSPFKFMKIRDLPSSQNNNTVCLQDILGNPLIKEAWVFNYCFDVDWLMTHFDADVRSLVKVKVVHGSWKKEDGNRIGIEEACQRWSNVEALTAYLPDPFGTHHSKMFVLFTHDDQAQVVIHTANMLNKDWSNLTQAIWQSPMLPMTTGKAPSSLGAYGSGTRFKHDLMAYLGAYGSKTKALREQLVLFDFTAIRGALIASVPSRIKDSSIKDLTYDSEKLWGYPSLCRVLRSMLTRTPENTSRSPHLVCQTSSIATLSPAWLNRFFPSILTNVSTSHILDHVSIIFPTPSNVASSLDGYASGGSIHTKAQTPAHLKQITSMRGSLCQWTRGPSTLYRAGRHEAAPHIKTYVQYQEKPTASNPVPAIDWALLTSANLSTQAWGAYREKEKEVVVQSFEIGVLVWPELFSDDFDTGDGLTNPMKGSESNGSARSSSARMVPVFGKDTPSPPNAPSKIDAESDEQPTTIVGLRIPYDLPLTPYGPNELPWSPQGTYETRDRRGRRWPRDFFR